MQLDENFEEILNDFFKKYDQRQFRHNKPHKIAVTFKGREDEVMAHLCKKYDVDPKTIAGMASPSPALPEGEGEPTLKEPSKSEEETNESVKEAETSPDEVSTEPDEKPKSKKKLVIIVVIVILLVAAGAAGYLFKDKILGIITATEQDSPTPALPAGEGEPTLKKAKDEVDKTAEPPEAATDEQTDKEEEDETEKVKEEGNDEGGSDEETSGEEK